MSVTWPFLYNEELHGQLTKREKQEKHHWTQILQLLSTLLITKKSQRSFSIEAPNESHEDESMDQRNFYFVLRHCRSLRIGAVSGQYKNIDALHTH